MERSVSSPGWNPRGFHASSSVRKGMDEEACLSLRNIHLNQWISIVSLPLHHCNHTPACYTHDDGTDPRARTQQEVEVKHVKEGGVANYRLRHRRLHVK